MNSSELRPEWLYPPADGRHDDMLTAEGALRPHWLGILDSLYGLEDMNDRQQNTQRFLRDDGATYNIYGDLNQQSTTWNLDLVPNVIGSEDWAGVESGLLERSELLNLLLRDIYGERSLIRTGVIPPEALFCHRGFLRACHGIQLPGDHDLILHAVDLIRDANGDFMVLGDRTQSPSGAGYALENRTVMSRVFPSLFRDSHVHRLSAFFQRLRAKLLSLSPDPAQARVALLTPGPHNETYFEHAYMANYLGFPLVQSDDLMVRNGRLWMKSLDGLKRVDVLLRRVDDWFCDPVELRADSRLGVPGLLEVVRAGNLVVANPLGSGVIENPVFLKYLPEISKALLGRELRLPSVQTWWCGDTADKEYVLANLKDLIIKPVYRKPGEASVRACELDDTALAQLANQIERDPLQFIAQPFVRAGHLPSLENQQLAPRPAVLRTFAVASAESYTLMPGGLTRSGADENSFVIANQAGARSKDTWVVDSEPERLLSSEHAEDQVATREAESVSLPSRVVENLFWMGRYAERAECTLRILRTTFMQFSSESPATALVKEHLLAALQEIAILLPDEQVTPEQQLERWVQNGTLSNSIASNLNSMLFCADQAKELLSSDTFRIINDIRDALVKLPNDLNNSLRSAPEEVLDPLVTALMAFAGLTQESMNRSFGWRFMELGRRLERAQQINKAVSGLLVPVVNETDQNRLAESLLLTLETLISYRRRYRGRMSVQTSLDLILLDKSNPRSLMYQLETIADHLKALPKPNTVLHELTEEERTLMRAEVLIKLTPLKELSREGKPKTAAADAMPGAQPDGIQPQAVQQTQAPNGQQQQQGGQQVQQQGQQQTMPPLPEAAPQRDKLHEAMEECHQLMAGLSDQITDKYFDHREASQQLVRNSMEML